MLLLSSTTSSSRMLMRYTILLGMFVSLALGAIKRSSVSVNDLSLHQYTEEGEIAQIKYANEAVIQAMPILGWIEPSLDASVFITCSHVTSPLCFSGSQTSDVLEERTMIATTGLRTDCRQLLQEANNIMLSNQFIFSNSPTVEKLCNKLAVWLTKGMYSQSGNDESADDDDDPPPTRPYATAALISQYDTIAKKVKLFQLLNSGSFQECSFSCLGKLDKESVSKIRLVALSDTTISTTITTSSSTESKFRSSFDHESRKSLESDALFAKLNKVLRILSLELDQLEEGTGSEIKFQVSLIQHDKICRTELTSQQLLKLSILHDT